MSAKILFEDPVSLERRLLNGLKRTASGCWEWMKCRKKGRGQGYGKMGAMRNGKHYTYATHRLAYRLFRSDIPDGLQVCHHCDNPPCCNPNHLFLGTVKDNADDMVRKGRCGAGGAAVAPERRQRGEKAKFAKLTTEQVAAIRSEYVPGVVTQAMLAKKYGVCYQTIAYAIRGRTWNHVGGHTLSDHRKKENGSKSIPPRAAKWSEQRRQKYDAAHGVT